MTFGDQMGVFTFTESLGFVYCLRKKIIKWTFFKKDLKVAWKYESETLEGWLLLPIPVFQGLNREIWILVVLI